MSEPRYFHYTRDGVQGVISYMCREGSQDDHPSLGHVLATSLQYQPTPSGFPDSKDYKHLISLEDRLDEALAGQGFVHFGHILGDGRFLVVFRGSQPGPTEITVKLGLLRKETVQLFRRFDERWEWHEAELVPTRRERVSSGQQDLHDQLKESGNVATIPRPVDFTARFRTADAASRFAEAMVAQGFTRGTEAIHKEAEDDFWCDLQLVTPVDEPTITTLSIQVEDLAVAAGGAFDGWGCPVVTGG